MQYYVYIYMLYISRLLRSFQRTHTMTRRLGDVPRSFPFGSFMCYSDLTGGFPAFNPQRFQNCEVPAVLRQVRQRRSVETGVLHKPATRVSHSSNHV